MLAYCGWKRLGYPMVPWARGSLQMNPGVVKGSKTPRLIYQMSSPSENTRNPSQDTADAWMKFMLHAPKLFPAVLCFSFCYGNWLGSCIFPSHTIA